MPESNPSPEPQSVVNADGSFSENWHEKYGEENKAHLSRYKNFDEFVSSHVEQRKKFSKDPSTLIEIPTEHSSDKVKAAFRKAKGVPDESDSYEYTLSDEMAVKLGPVNDKKMSAFREFAHKQEWNQKQFSEALDFYHANIAGDIDAGNIAFNEKNAAAAAAGKAELRKKEGWRTEKEYEDKVLRANSVMRRYGGEEAVAAFNAENSPEMAMFLDNIAEAMSEDTLKGVSSSPGTTSANIKMQIAENRSQMDKIMDENPSNYRGSIKFRELDKSNTELYKQMPA